MENAKHVGSANIAWFALASCVLVAAGNPCTLKVLDKESGAQIDNLCLEEFVSSECRPFVSSFTASDLPAGLGLGEPYFSVERPSSKSLDVNGLVSPFNHSQKHYLRPGMSVSWESPVSSSAKRDIKGYLLTWDYEGSNNLPACRIFKFDSTDQDRLLKPLKFEFEIEFIQAKANYEARVYSLAPPESLEKSKDPQTYASMNLVSASVVVNSKNPGDWTPSLTAKALDGGSVLVKIGRAPDTFNLTQFNVMLLKRSVDENNYYQLVEHTADASSDDQTTVDFTGLESDEYKVVVHVIDPFSKIEGQCLCWTEETNGQHCKNACGSVGTDWFSVQGAGDETTSAPQGTTGINTPSASSPLIGHQQGGGFGKTEVVIIVLVAAVILVIVGVVAAVLVHMNQKKKYSAKRPTGSMLKKHQ